MGSKFRQTNDVIFVWSPKMSSERFEECEEQLKVLLATLEDSLGYQIATKSGDDRRRNVQALEKQHSQAQTLLSEIQLELRQAPTKFRQQASGRVARYRAELESLGRRLGATPATREELFSREQSDPFESDDDREHVQLLKNTQTIHKASQSLHRAQQVSANTDAIAVDILEDLDDQKESLLRTRSKVSQIDSEMDRTKLLVRSIFWKTVQNTVLLIIVIIIELVLLAGLTYWKFFTS